MKETGLKKINQRHFTQQSHNAIEDYVIIEEPLLISLYYLDADSNDYKTTDLTVVMRTPGKDTQLIIGFLFNEQVINSEKDILNIKINDESQNNNHVIVKLAESVKPNWQKITRAFASQSSCGICGKTSLNSLAISIESIINNENAWLKSADIITLANDLKSHQPLFQQTGGVHGAGYVVNNKLRCVYEDVGRHNAVDKVIGDIIINNKHDEKSILVLSGRISFELMQKAITAAIPVIVAIGAPSSLAISAAIQFNITLIGFTKNNQFNVYHGNHRIDYDTSAHDAIK